MNFNNIGACSLTLNYRTVVKYSLTTTYKVKRNVQILHIANTFFRAGFIESWGRGIQKIQEGCEEANIPLPEYTVKKEDLMVMFKNTTQATTQAQSLSVNDQKLLQCIQKNPSFSQKQIAQELQWSIDNVKYYVKKLKSANLLEYTGTSQKGKWVVKKGDVQ